MANPAFVRNWVSMRDVLWYVWVSRMVQTAVDRQKKIEVVDWAVLLPSACQMWDRWAWTGGLFSSEEERSARSDDWFHSCVMYHLGYRTPGMTDLELEQDSVALTVWRAMDAFSAAVHVASSWSGSWLSMDELCKMRLTAPRRLSAVYVEVDAFVRMGPSARAPTLTSMIAQRHATGVATMNEYKRLYDLYCKCRQDASDIPKPAFWAWGLGAASLLTTA